ncbi:uncharacterized protein LOC113867606 [Abrus precatorius]|uniref:Uncharacterized protein LOC113867606 n=1 Tax=Abrus precatorius TaxID=3816 RepID=A0A8B8LR10_ABRPR|nr:uncharacterized protein LOC113867606 [Abrus precatorius]
MEQQETWEECLLLIEFTYNNSYHASLEMAPYEALYGRKCRTPLCWYESGEAILHAIDLVQRQNDQIKMIKEKMKISQDRQKSYYDNRRKLLEFQVGDHVFLRVSPITRVAYEIALSPNLSKLHRVFHVSQLRKYIPDPFHVIKLDPVQVRENISYEVFLVKIADRRVKQLMGKEISLVKMIWSTNDEGDATWELEDQMREAYPHLFLS